MNILQIIPELNVGGVETGTVDLARYFVEQGHKSIVVSSGGALVEDLEKGGSKHYKLSVHQKNPWLMVRMIGPLRQLIKNEKIDIVHARSRVPAWIAYFACRGTSAKFITTCHGYYGNRFFSQVMGWGKIVICPSEVIARHMVDDYHVPRERIRIIPRSVNLKKFNIVKDYDSTSSEQVVSIVGRITPLKGHAYFLQAMAKVIRTMPFLKIWIIGDAPKNKLAYKEELQALVSRLGISKNVEFLGNRSDVPDLLSKTNVLVLSTVTQEAFGRVILEAQAVGVPVVATTVGGVIDIIDHEKTGLLVSPKDIEAMAKEVSRLLNDRVLAQRIVKGAREKLLAHFTLEHMAVRTMKIYEEVMKSTSILVIKISSLGDVILVTPSLKALRRKFPQAQIHCLVGEESRQVLQHCPYLDETIVYDYKGKEAGIGGIWRMGQKLRMMKYDYVIDFQNNKKSHLLAFLSFTAESLGFHNGKWSFLLSHPVKGYQNDIPAVSHQFQILKELGINREETDSLELWPSKQDHQYIQNFLDEEWLGNVKNIVGIHLSASSKWQTKNWPVEYIAQLCDKLAANNIRVIITGIDKDKSLVYVLKKCLKSKPSIFIGKTDILQLSALIKRCRVFITPDSAPLHVAAAMQTPVIAFFGPTSSVRHAPPAKNIIVMEKKLTCAPCYSPRCRILTHACMKDITPDTVLKAVEELLGEKV